MRIGVIFLSALFLFSACIQKGKVEIEGLDQVPKPTKAGGIQSTLTSVSIQNDQLVINGSGFNNVSKVQVKGPSGFNETFSIESKTDSNIIANGLNAISFAMGSTFDLILSNASAAASYPVTFTLQDGAVTAAKLNDMGAGDGDVLVYNQSLTTWEPSPLSSISYRGSWNADTNTPSLSDGGGSTSPTAGDFYVVNTSGSTAIDGNSTWNAGDWIIYDAVNTKWDRIANTSNVTSVYGRQGAVTASEGDYTIDQLGDVDTTTSTPSDGQVLKWDAGNSQWVVGDDLSGGGAGSVTSTEIQDGAIVNVDISGSAAIAQSKINNLTSDLAAKLPLDGSNPMSGSLDMGANSITNVGNVDGVDVSSLNTAVAGKADEPSSVCSGTDKLTWDGTTFSCASDVDTDTNTNADTLCTAGEYLDGDGTCKIASTGNGDFMADGSVPMTGDLDFGFNKARLKSDNSNYAELIAPSGLVATYTLTLPANDGNNGDVLSVDASGNLQWSTSGSGSVTSVTGSAPIASSGGNNPDISISQANSTTNGYLSSTDWNTFNDKQDAITTGSTSQYLRGDLSLSSFPTDVAGSVLTNFATGVDTTVTNTDTVETAVEKIQGQINANDTAIAGKQDDLAAPADGTQYLDGNETWQTLNTDAVTEAANLYFTESRVFGSLLSGYSTGADTALADGDTLLQALAKLEGQIQADASNAFLKDGSVAMTGTFDGGGNDLTNVGSLSTSNQAGVTLNSYGSTTGQTGELRLNDLDDTNYVGLKSPDTVSSNQVWTLPNADGANGAALVTDNSGNLYWSTSLPPSGSAGGDLTGSYPSPDIGSAVIVDGDVNASANISASKLGTGAVSNTEFNYLDGVTSGLQAQLNDKVDIGGDTMTGALNLPANGLTIGTNQLTTDSGRVGIGTASPTESLDVSGNLKISGDFYGKNQKTVTINSSIPENSTFQRLKTTVLSTRKQALIKVRMSLASSAGVSTHAGIGVFELTRGDSGVSVNTLYINNGSNDYLLTPEVTSNEVIWGVKAHNNGTSTTYNLTFVVDVFSNNPGSFAISEVTGSTVASGLAYQKYESNGTLVTDTSSRVGIGTDSPSSKLEIQQDTGAGSEASLITLDSDNSSIGNGSSIDWRNSAAGYFASVAGIDDNDFDGRLEFRVSNDGASTSSPLSSSDTVMTLDQSGSLGIGTTSPSSWSKLDVNGKIDAEIPHAYCQAETGGITFTTRGSEVTQTACSVTVPENGTYLTNVNGRLWNLQSADDWWRIDVFNTSTSTSLFKAFGLNTNFGSGSNGDTTASGTQILSLTKGEVLTVRYYVKGTGTSTVNTTDGNGGYSLNIVRLSD